MGRAGRGRDRHRAWPSSSPASSSFGATWPDCGWPSTGIITGVIAAIMSAPISAIAFGGVTGSGTDLIVAALRKGGADVLQASLGQGFFSDPIDKLITSFVVFIILVSLSRALPRALPTRRAPRPPGRRRHAGRRAPQSSTLEADRTAAAQLAGCPTSSLARSRALSQPESDDQARRRADAAASSLSASVAGRAPLIGAPGHARAGHRRRRLPALPAVPAGHCRAAASRSC